ncbi:MAG: H-NS histone family protein [Rhodospirillales bacterium]|nr:H-NS histone family protein [Rhodospirillales bacterium]QQS11093.1 MAG: H-NS histone family protein [Rhodospirillales bacterium]
MPRAASLKTIEAKIRALQARADKLKKAEKPGVKQLKAVVRKYKLTMADVTAAMKGRPAASKGAKGAKTRTVKPKYRNPADKSETWAGRGSKPRWVVAALKSGKKLEDLAI